MDIVSRIFIVDLFKLRMGEAVRRLTPAPSLMLSLKNGDCIFNVKRDIPCLLPCQNIAFTSEVIFFFFR